MGRLEDIIERNKHPGKTARKRSGGIGVGFAMVVVFVALILLIFTDLAAPPDADLPAPATPTAKPDGVRGIKLWSPKRGSGGSIAGSGAATGSGSGSAR